MHQFDVTLIEEIGEQDFDGLAQGAGAAGLSKRLGNNGRVCTLTKECQRICW